LGKAELVDEDVYTGSVYFIGDSKLLYFKDVEDYEGDLYINGKNIDSDVYVYYSMIRYTDDTVYYVTDYDDEDGCGTLKMTTGKKGVKLYDDVHSFSLLPDGTVVFLYDYSDKHFTGELYYCSGKKAKKIDEDVSCIVSYSYVTSEN
ncbi:MAG: hypothetical protein IJD22_00885, partial [Clostridia bacterium]|nr:hypothetical protein [Clostridia bacterium]